MQIQFVNPVPVLTQTTHYQPTSSKLLVSGLSLLGTIGNKVANAVQNSYLVRMAEDIEVNTMDKYEYSYAGLVTHEKQGVVFHVQAKNDAHIALTHNGIVSKDTWEIVLGGWNNECSVIRTSPQGNPVAVYPGQILKNNKWFWICWDDYAIHVGTGKFPGQGVIMSAQRSLLNIQINHMHVSTGFGSSGIWNINVKGMLKEKYLDFAC